MLNPVQTQTNQIKSRERVKTLAEVYTNEKEVNAMLDLLPLNAPNQIISYKYLEPSCGNGNFLVEILRRKLKCVNDIYASKSKRVYEFYLAQCLFSIYGIDICPENIFEAKARMFQLIKSSFDLHKGSYYFSNGFLSLIYYILDTNIVVGDSINNPAAIMFIDYKTNGKKIEQRIYNFKDLIDSKPKLFQMIPGQYFLNIGLNYERK